MDAEIGSYADQPKAEPTGTKRIAPMRSAGEAEVRGYVTDINSNVFKLLDKNADFEGDALNSESLIHDRVMGNLATFSERLTPTSRMNHGRLFEQELAKQAKDIEAETTFIGNMGETEADGDYRSIGMLAQAEMAEIHKTWTNLEGLLDPAEEDPTSRSAKSIILEREPLSMVEYLNRKMRSVTPPVATAPRPIQKFIFEPDTIMTVPLSKIRTDLFMPYPECLFVIPHKTQTMNGLVLLNTTVEVIAKELSKTKFFLWLTIDETELCVQVNQFASKKKDDEYEYRAYMAEGPNMLLGDDDPRQGLKEAALRVIEPIFSFLEGLSKRKYSLLSNGTVIQGNQVPPPAALGDIFKVLKYTTDKAYQKRIYKGGTHARPREHERIAHKRMLRNGEVRLFPQTTVNKGVGGRVIKDYLIIDPETE